MNAGMTDPVMYSYMCSPLLRTIASKSSTSEMKADSAQPTTMAHQAISQSFAKWMP